MGVWPLLTVYCIDLKSLIKMRILSISLTLSILIASCNGQKETSQKDYTDQLKSFPVDTLMQMIEEISKEDWQVVLDGRFSNTWMLVKSDSISDIKIVNKASRDNWVEFKFSEKNNSLMVMVTQFNAQNQTTKQWSYSSTSNPNWNLVQLPQISLSDYLAENVNLPEEYAGYEPYLIVETFQDSVIYRLNKELLVQGVAKYYNSDPEVIVKSYVKYYHRLIWNGKSFDIERLLDNNYQEVLEANAEINEQTEDGPEPTYWDCSFGFSAIASSTLNAPDTTYAIKNIQDYNDATAWSEGNPNNGVGEWIEFTNKEGFEQGDVFNMQNGYIKNPDVWKANNRIKRMAAYYNDKLIAYVNLADITQYQSFSIEPSWRHGIAFKKGDKFKFVIEEIYKGEKYDDTLITYLAPTGGCPN